MPLRTGDDRRTDILSVTFIYAAVMLGSYFLASPLLEKSPAMPGYREIIPSFIIVLVPLALLGLIIWRIRSLAIDRARRVFGSRERIRIVLLFMVVTLMASLPQALFLGRLVYKAVNAPSVSEINAALGAGMGASLDRYKELLTRLEYETSVDAPALAARTDNDPARILAALARRNSSIVAVEFFPFSGAPSFSGDTRARSQADMVLKASDGYLPRMVFDDASVIRYRKGLEKPSGAVVVISAAIPAAIESSAETSSAALALVERIHAFSSWFPLVILFFYGIFILPALTLSLLFGLIAADSACAPLITLNRVINRVSKGSKDLQVITKPDDELGILLSGFNHMLLNLERAREEALSAEKISVWQDIAQKLAHELKNPLTPIRLAAERVLKKSQAEPERVGEILEKSMLAIIQEADGMDHLLSEFRSFARLPEPTVDWVNALAIVKEAMALYEEGYPDVAFDLSGVQEDIVIRVDRAQFRQVLANLVRNSIDAMDGKGRISFRTDLVKTEESRYCRFHVRDNGRGISPENRSRIFSPYFTTKTNGTGLGLAIVQHIVHDHGGSIRFDSEPGAGTVFIIDFPVDR